jgi:Flp pilus assembly protein TadB
MSAPEDPILVTTAPVNPADERRTRERRYLITMAIRVIAFILAIVLASGWVRVIAIALALVLPWVAVVVANAGPVRRERQRPSLLSGHRHHEIS